MVWEAKSRMQKDVLESKAMIVCAGGSAGTYKSETLLVDAVQEYQKAAFHERPCASRHAYYAVGVYIPIRRNRGRDHADAA